MRIYTLNEYQDQNMAALHKWKIAGIYDPRKTNQTVFSPGAFLSVQKQQCLFILLEFFCTFT